jgi:peptidoglycan biosynthesis protein MviN/MurJ (putative lipid II flippase)
MDPNTRDNKTLRPAHFAGRPLAGIVFSLSAIAVLAKVFGFAEKIVIAYFFGAGETTDVYFASVGVVLSVVFIVKELVYPSLLPVFAESMSESARASAGLFRKVFLSAAGVLTTFCLFSYMLRFDEFKAVWSLLRFRKAAVSTLYGEPK